MSKFGFQSIEHALAGVGRDLVVGAREAAAVASRASVAAPTIEELTGLLEPRAVVIERAAFAALGMIAKASNDTGSSVSNKGLNVAMDAQTINDFKQVYTMLAGLLQAQAETPRTPMQDSQILATSAGGPGGTVAQV